MTPRCTAAILAAGAAVLLASVGSVAANPVPAAGTTPAAAVTAGGQAALNLVFVLDGLRPDSISETETPTIARLRRQGVEFTNPERGADILVTFSWSSERNAFGVLGTATFAGSRTGPVTGDGSNHGSFSPWDVHNTMLAWASTSRTGCALRCPPATSTSRLPCWLSRASRSATPSTAGSFARHW